MRHEILSMVDEMMAVNSRVHKQLKSVTGTKRTMKLACKRVMPNLEKMLKDASSKLYSITAQYKAHLGHLRKVGVFSNLFFLHALDMTDFLDRVHKGAATNLATVQQLLAN